MVNTRIKKAICELGDLTCEQCKKRYRLNELIIHRIRRGESGGTYHWRNCMLLCRDCHKLIHYGEFPHISG